MESSSYPIESLHRRLFTGLGNKGGARGSLTRCAVRLSGLKRALAEVDGSTNSTTGEDMSKNDEIKAAGEKDGTSAENSSTGSAIAEASDALARELELSRIELTKLYFLKQRQEKELEELQESNKAIIASSSSGPPENSPTKSRAAILAATSATIGKERQAVHQLRKDLQQALSTVAAKAEYEQTAKLLCAQHPTSTGTLTHEIEELQAALNKARREHDMSKAQMRLRKSQFRALMQCMLDLKQSLNEPLSDEVNSLVSGQKDSGTTDDEAEGDDDQNDNHDSNNELNQPGSNTRSAIAIMEEDDEDEEGALYDDL